MAIPNKTITDANAVLNRFAPDYAHIIGLWALTETSGTTFDNLGVRDTYGGSIDTDAAALADILGTGALTFTTAATDPVNGPYITTDDGTTDSAKIDLMTNETGSIMTFSQGTVLFRFRDPTGAAGVPGALRVFLNSGGPGTSATANLSINRIVTSGNLEVRVASDTFTYTSATEIDWDVWHTIIVMWGAGRVPKVILDRNNLTVTSAGGTKVGTTTSGSVSIPTTRDFQIGSTAAGGTRYAVDASIAVLWDKRIDMHLYSDKRINRLLSDPWLCARPAPSLTGVFSTVAAALSSRVDEDSALISLVTGLGDSGDVTGVLTGSNGDIKWYIEIGTSDDPTNANHCNSAGTTQVVAATTDIITKTEYSATGLSPNVTYFYRVMWSSDDGVTYQPLPGGLQRFRTKRTVAGNWTPGMLADPHLNNNVDIWDMSVLSNIRFGPANFNATDPSQKAMAYERAIEFQVMYRDNDFTMILGDYLMSDQWHVSDGSYTIDQRNNLLFYDAAVRAAHERNFAYELYLDGMVITNDGNHETRSGYSQCGDRSTAQSGTRAAYQAIGTNIIKMFWPTYTNGENEGDPSLNSSLSWLAPNSGHVATYGRTQYLIDYVTGSTANPRSLNKSPLETYFSFEWGGGINRTLFVLTHASFYTDPGDIAASSHSVAGWRQRRLGTFTRGTIQEAWIESVYAASDAPIKLEFAHHHTGGILVADAENTSVASANTSYGRNTGLTETGAEHVRSHERMRTYGVNAKFTQHDHRACHALADGNVNEINNPTSSAPNLSGGGSGTLGWHLSEHQQNAGFGLAESDGADLVTLGDGLGTALGNLKMLNVLGVATLDIDGHPDGPLLQFVRTDVAKATILEMIVTQTGSPGSGTWRLTIYDNQNVAHASSSLAWNISDADLLTELLAMGMPSDTTVVRTGAGTDFVWTITSYYGNIYFFYTIPFTSTFLTGSGTYTASCNRLGLGQRTMYIERNLGELLYASADAVVLSTNPRTVYEAHLYSSVVRGTPGGNFWDFGYEPASVKGTDVGSYAPDWDQPDSESVTLDSSVNESQVYVMNTPAILYSARLGIPDPLVDSVSYPAGSRATRLSVSGALSIATVTQWELTDILNGTTFTIRTTSSGTRSSNVLDSDLDTLDIWLPPYHSYMFRTRQQVAGAWGAWSDYVTFTSRDPLNSFDTARSLNASSLTYANDVLVTDDVADVCTDGTCVQTDDVENDNADRT